MQLRSSTSSNLIPSTSSRPNEDGPPNEAYYNIPVRIPQEGDPKTELYQKERQASPIRGLGLNLKFDLNGYREMQDKDFSNVSDIEARKKVIGMISEHEDLWAFKRVCVPRERWEEFAVKHFLRTGNLSNDIHIRTIWGAAKKELLEILTRSIQSRDNKKETEEKLKTWDLYSHISFYRAVTREYEVELKKKVNGRPCARHILEDTLAFTDVVTSYQDVQGNDGTIHQKLVIESPLTLDETDTGTTRKIRAPVRKPGLSMTLMEYRALKEEQFENRKDLMIRKLIVAVIEEFPRLWEQKKVRAPRAEWERMAIELYLRTEVLLSVELIREIFNEAKEKLRRELQFSKFQNLSLQKTELKLDGWDLYQQIKFFREAMQEYDDIDVNVVNVFADEILLDMPGDEGQPGFFNPVQPETGPLVFDGLIHGINAGVAGLALDPQNDDAHPAVDNNPSTPLFPKVPVPDKIDGMTMSLEEYKKCKIFVKKTDLESTKKIIAVLETHKELWKHKGVAMPLEKWQNLAVDVFLRTSLLLKVPFIRDVWKRAKDQLRGKIRATLMAKDEESFKAALNRLRSWELYEQVKFFRVVMKEYEEETKKKQRGLEYNADLVDDEDPFADIIYIEKITGNAQDDMLQYPRARLIEMKPELDHLEMEEEEEVEEPEGLQKIRIPGPRPGVQMTIDEYKKMENDEFDNQSDARAKKWVLCLIEKTPALWCRRNIKTTVAQWQELAVEFYLRTGSSMSVTHLRSIWKNLKESMRKRLCKPWDSAKIEEELEKWEFYLQMKFYRKIMKEVEDARRKKFEGEAHDEEILNDPTAFDEDIVVTRTVEGTGIFPKPIKMELNYKAEEPEAYYQNYSYHYADDRVETKPYHILAPVKHERDYQEEFQMNFQDGELEELAPPENAIEEDLLGDAEFALERMVEMAEEGHQGADNLVTALMRAFNRPNLEDGVTQEFVNSIREVVMDRVNKQDSGKENRPTMM